MGFKPPLVWLGKGGKGKWKFKPPLVLMTTNVPIIINERERGKMGVQTLICLTVTFVCSAITRVISSTH